MDTLEELLEQMNSVNERVIHKLVQAKVALTQLTSLSEQFFKEELDASYLEEMNIKIIKLLDRALEEREQLS